MVNPNFTQKEPQKFTPSDGIKKLFQAIYREQNKTPISDDEPKIRVSEVISKVAFYYEKIRNTVDDKEEHLLHKNATDRIIKRQVNIELAKEGKEIAKHLLIELIRAGYLPNNQLPETKIGEVGEIIERYLKFRKHALAGLPADYEGKKELSNWIVSLAACEIEERMKRSEVDNLVVTSMYEFLVKNIRLPDESAYQKDKEIQLFISINRHYFKSDNDMVSYILLRYFLPHWQEANDEEIARAGKSILDIKKAVDFQLHHPLAGQLNRIVNRYTVYFTILTEVIAEDPMDVYDEFKKDPKAFPRRIKNVCNKRYRGVRAKLWRAAVRSIIYLFITKSILILILEIPVARLLGETVNNFTLGVNVAFPPLLLFLIILFTALPSDKNTAKIVEGIEEWAFTEKTRKEPFQLRPPVKRTGAKNAIFGFIYTVTFFLSFGAVVWVLNQLDFNFVSIIIFLFFLALISFFSIRIRKRVREMMVVEARENIFIFVVDFFYVPIIAVGKWLSEKFSRLNVFVFILDIIIEAPFKIFVEIAEEWSKYVKERKDDISQ